VFTVVQSWAFLHCNPPKRLAPNQDRPPTPFSRNKITRTTNTTNQMPPKKKGESKDDGRIPLLGRSTNNVGMGIVGMPNVGKVRVAKDCHRRMFLSPLNALTIFPFISFPSSLPSSTPSVNSTSRRKTTRFAPKVNANPKNHHYEKRTTTKPLKPKTKRSWPPSNHPSTTTTPPCNHSHPPCLSTPSPFHNLFPQTPTLPKSPSPTNVLKN
jgi:hypothetical protein